MRIDPLNSKLHEVSRLDTKLHNGDTDPWELLRNKKNALDTDMHFRARLIFQDYNECDGMFAARGLLAMRAKVWNMGGH